MFDHRLATSRVSVADYGQLNDQLKSGPGSINSAVMAQAMGPSFDNITQNSFGNVIVSCFYRDATEWKDNVA